MHHLTQTHKTPTTTKQATKISLIKNPRNAAEHRTELQLFPHIREDLTDWYIPRVYLDNYYLEDYKDQHSLRGIAINGVPKSPEWPNITIVRHSDIFKPQQALKEYNNLVGLAMEPNDYTSTLLYAYIDPDTDHEDGGKYLETFYTVQTGDFTNNLADEISRKAVFKLDQIYSIVEQLLMGIRSAEQNGIFHGAVCASNILIERSKDSFKTKLINFGANAENQQVNVMSEPHSRSPEYIARYAPVNIATDMWGVSALALRLLTGQVIFHQENDLAVLEEMIRLFGSDKTAFTDKFMKGLIAKAPPRLIAGRLWEHLKPALSIHLGSIRKDHPQMKALIELIVDTVDLLQQNRATPTQALERWFGQKLDAVDVEPHKFYNERDYYNFDGDMDESDIEVEKWASRIYQLIPKTSYIRLAMDNSAM